MLKYQRGTSVNLYANFLTLENKEAISIVDPKVTVRHVDSGGIVVIDVNEQPMTAAIETLYFFKWTLPLTADLGMYTVEYEATIDGEYAEANESFEVVEGDVVDCDVPLTDVDKVAEYLGVDVSNINSYWIEWATAYIETYTCQKFCPVTLTQKYDIDKKNQEVLILEGYPLLELLTVVDNGVSINTNNFLVYEDESILAIDKDSTYTDAIGNFTRGRQKVHVTYRFGYSAVPSEIEWAATVLASSIAAGSLTSSGTITGGAVIEEEIGEYRVKRSSDSTSTTSFSSSVEGSKDINDRLEEDVFSAKNVLRMYRDRKMRAI